MARDLDDVPDPLALENQVCFALVVASRSVLALYRPILEPMGLTHPQYLVMLALWEHGQLSVKELSRLLQLDPGTLSPLLKRLEAAGLVERRRSREDERSVSVHLTGQGAALRTRAADVPTRILEATGLDLQELLALRETLHRVTASLDAAR